MPAYSVTTEALLGQLARTKGGSDLILTVGKPPQFKIYGEVGSMPACESLTPEAVEGLCLSVLNEQQIKRFHEDKELDVSRMAVP